MNIRDTAFYSSVTSGKWREVRSILDSGAFSAVDLQVGLVLASIHGRLAISRMLLDSGADPNGCSAELRMPLPLPSPMLAASTNGRTGVLRLLVERGADIDKRGHSGSSENASAISLALSHRHMSAFWALFDMGASIEPIAEVSQSMYAECQLKRIGRSRRNRSSDAGLGL